MSPLDSSHPPPSDTITLVPAYTLAFGSSVSQFARRNSKLEPLQAFVCTFSQHLYRHPT